MGHTGDDLLVRRNLGCNLHTNVRLALVVQRNQFVCVLAGGVGVVQADSKLRGIAPPQAICRYASGEWTDECNLYGVSSLPDEHPVNTSSAKEVIDRIARFSFIVAPVNSLLAVVVNAEKSPLHFWERRQRQSRQL